VLARARRCLRTPPSGGQFRSGTDNVDKRGAAHFPLSSSGAARANRSQGRLFCSTFIDEDFAGPARTQAVR
jgi:hypothetical protein